MSVRQEDNGTWTAQFWYRDYKGERRHKKRRGFKTQEEAERFEEENSTEGTGSIGVSFATFYKTYEEDMKPRLRESTWISKDYMVKDKILPFFGDMRMEEIEPVDIVRWQNQLMERRGKNGKPYSQTYLRSVWNQLKAIFNHAVKLYGLKSSPCARVEGLGSKKCDEMKFWTKEEYLRFADAAMDKPDTYHAFEILYWCGLRSGEMLALTPADFDFRRSVIKVTKTFQRIKGRDVVTPPKTPKSNREVVMPKFLADEMKEYLGQRGIRSDQRVFAETKSYLHHEMDRCSKIAGVKRIRIHDLRHSHVSLLIDMGFTALAIADRMGHESASITYKYAHLFPTTQTDMAKALDNGRRVL